MPVFYCEHATDREFQLPEDESRHCIKVLRHKKGDTITVIDGKGLEKKVRIISDKPSKVVCETISEQLVDRLKNFRVHIAIAPTKNMDRTEWFVEKACELDIDEISFIFTEHSERKVLKTERLHKKAISALKQSGGRYRTIINEPVRWKQFLAKAHTEDQKFIAYVDHGNTETIRKLAKNELNYLIVIGPEGDFSPGEFQNATKEGFKSISLGSKVLRTETAGLIACHSFNFINDF
ncbi:MAG: RsmE family RNA methyltransferase [Cyclobacteriaceae bacterium]